MKPFVITGSSAVNITIVATVTRVFYSIVIEMPSLYCAGWISVIIGGIISFPVFFCLDRLSAYASAENHSYMGSCKLNRTVAAIFLFTALQDSALTARCISGSASYTAFDHSIRFFLLLPLFAAVFWALYCGGNAIGDSARIWMHVFPLLFILIVLFQFREYRWTWLTPVFGPGLTDILNGSVSVAGRISCAAPVLYYAAIEHQNNDRANFLKAHPIIVVSAAVLIVLRNMMAPTMLSAGERTRMHQLDIMLTNGRAPLLLQMPLIIIWFISLFDLLACDCFVAGKCIQTIFPGTRPVFCGLIAIVSSALLSMSVFSDGAVANVFSRYLFVLNSAAIAVALIVNRPKGGFKSCATPP